jgi:hypothetical protein
MLKTLLPISSTWENRGEGAIEFDENGKVVGYEKIANGTSRAPLNGSLGYLVKELRLGICFMQVDPYGIKSLKYLDSLGTFGL